MEAQANELSDQVYKISIAVKCLTASFVLILFFYLFSYFVLKGMGFVYISAPVVLVFWLSIVRLAWLASGWGLALVALILAILPPFLLIPMIMAFSRAKRLVEREGKRLTYWGVA